MAVHCKTCGAQKSWPRSKCPNAGCSTIKTPPKIHHKRSIPFNKKRSDAIRKELAAEFDFLDLVNIQFKEPSLGSTR